MPDGDRLDAWIDALRDRLARGELADISPFDIGDGTAGLPGETVIRIMLADLDGLSDLPFSVRVGADGVRRRYELLDDFRRLREVIG